MNVVSRDLYWRTYFLVPFAARHLVLLYCQFGEHFISNFILLRAKNEENVNEKSEWIYREQVYLINYDNKSQVSEEISNDACVCRLV